LGGSVLATNQRLAADPGLLGRDAEGAGWLMRVAPRDWQRDARAVTWGAGADRHYAACLAHDAADGDPFSDVRLERLRALPPVRGPGDVLAVLRAERASPRFADEVEVEVELGGRLREALAGDPGLRARLGSLDAVVRFALHDPSSALVLDLRAGARLLSDDEASSGEHLVLSCSAEDAYGWFTGGLDAAAALRRGDLVSSVASGPTLRALAVLKHLRIAGWRRAPSWTR
jgi:hypothetical protein